MTVAEIKEYIDERITGIRNNKTIENSSGEIVGVEKNYFSAEEVREELGKVLSMLDELPRDYAQETINDMGKVLDNAWKKILGD